MAARCFSSMGENFWLEYALEMLALLMHVLISLRALMFPLICWLRFLSVFWPWNHVLVLWVKLSYRNYTWTFGPANAGLWDWNDGCADCHPMVWPAWLFVSSVMCWKQLSPLNCNMLHYSTRMTSPDHMHSISNLEPPVEEDFNLAPCYMSPLWFPWPKWRAPKSEPQLCSDFVLTHSLEYTPLHQSSQVFIAIVRCSGFVTSMLALASGFHFRDIIHICMFDYISVLFACLQTYKQFICCMYKLENHQMSLRLSCE